jgi:hypothetical protein
MFWWQQIRTKCNTEYLLEEYISHLPIKGKHQRENEKEREKVLHQLKVTYTDRSFSTNYHYLF